LEEDHARRQTKKNGENWMNDIGNKRFANIEHGGAKTE